MGVVISVDPALGLDPRVVAFAVQALDQQAQEICKAWNLPPVAVSFYSWDVLLALKDGPGLDKFVADSWLMTIQASVSDDPSILAFHDDVAGCIFARCKPGASPTDWTDQSHELAEMLVDPKVDQYRPMPDGMQLALEVADPVQGDAYNETALIGSDTMAIAVSNFVTPNYFVAGSMGPWDKMGRLKGPFAMDRGGYQIVTSPDGSTTDVFAETIEGEANAAAKRARPDSRVARRLAR